jgi:methylmalonyl-CoA/ethylmalonyl-CoA epimerase
MEHMDNAAVWQIGIIVPDAKKSAEKAAEIFGVPLSSKGAFGTHGGYEHCGTKYNGKPTDGSGMGYCFMMGSVEVEFIQPIGDEPSTWLDFLKKNPKGGIHHIAWRVKDSDETTKFLAGKGVEKIAEGIWETGRYTYYDAKELGIFMEALQFSDERKLTD